MVPVYGQFIPLREILIKFFEMPEIYNEVFKYLQELKSDSGIISNFVQADYWGKKSVSFGNTLRIPLTGYFDDYETNNLVGSHAGMSGKCGAVYIDCPCLPIHLQSQIRIFTVLKMLQSIYNMIT